MKTLDDINTKMGSGTLQYASAGTSKSQAWKTVFKKRSPAYSIRWDQLLEVI